MAPSGAARWGNLEAVDAAGVVAGHGGGYLDGVAEAARLVHVGEAEHVGVVGAGVVHVLEGVDLGEGDLVDDVAFAYDGEGDHILGDDEPPLLPVAVRGERAVILQDWAGVAVGIGVLRTRLESFLRPCQALVRSREGVGAINFARLHRQLQIR